ncbi:MAG: DNA methyltransferase, partial [Rhodobacteraceae bacterium]|nr:DNA methyltransferase [Paracoccaceae bacterium]
WPSAWEVIDAANAIYMRRTKKNLSRPRDEVGSDMGAFLCFMAVRLMAMHRVLKPTGSIYLHCDHTASHYLKAIMDAIFGKNNFINEIVWYYESGGRSKSSYPKKHDVILWYQKTNQKKFNADAVSIPRTECSLCGTELAKWNNLKRHIDSDGRVYRTIKTAGKVYTYYDDEPTLPTDVWLGINHLQQKDPERYGYPTQKPLALLDRIIRASSDEGDVVLDPFCGCATTLVAAERAGRQWVGIDLWGEAHEAVIKRLVHERLMPPDGDRKDGDFFPVGQIHYTKEVPERTDGGGVAVEPFDVPESRNIPKEPWQKMNNQAIFDILVKAQSITPGLCLCAGCGRELEVPFMELDHIVPKAGHGIDDISNRILLCRPCNGRKNAYLTLPGLRRENRKVGWMKDERRADHAHRLAQSCYEEIRYG